MESLREGVRLVPGAPVPGDQLDGLARRTRLHNGDIEAAIGFAVQLGKELPPPLGGETLRLWESLATIAAVDLSTARVIEPHLDALGILAQAPELDSRVLGAVQDGSWGVFAAEARDARLEAKPSGAGWALAGTKPWCSLGGRLTHAVVTAHTDSGRQAFAVSLKQPGVRADDGGWTARGLANITSGPISFDNVPATPVGGPGWYLSRPGFAWGGAGVAAVWFGAATAVARRVYAHCTEREADQIACLHVGMIDAWLGSARNALALAARQADEAEPSVTPALAAGRARAAVVAAAEAILSIAGHAMGPGPLAFEPEHAARTADLALYLRQDHAERSTAALGKQLLREDVQPW